jgi:hypothetical protein
MDVKPEFSFFLEKEQKVKNMKQNQKAVLAICLAGGFLCSLSAVASVINPAFEPPTGGPNNPVWGANDPVNLGLVFTPVANITVNALGFYDTLGATGGETVAIYNSSGAAITSVNVSLSDLVDSYYWANIAPITLFSGQQYTVDAFVGNNTWSWSAIPQVPVVSSSITYVEPTYLYGGAPGFPIYNYPPLSAYYGPNLSVVPEPTTLIAGALMLLPFGASTLRILRRNRAV